MESNRFVRLLGTGDNLPLTTIGGDAPDRPASPLRRAILKARQRLLQEQRADGHWVAELEGDTILESEYILLQAWLEREDEPLARKCGQRIIDQQLPGGGWAMYPGGQVDPSVSVKAYFALKLLGHSPAAEYMQRARAAILAQGGADAVNSFTRFYLALLGQISYDHCPDVPPEMVLLPRWFPFNLYAMSSWTRTIVVPLAIMSACRPVRQIEPQRGIRELYLRDPGAWPYPRCPGLKRSAWSVFFHAADSTLKWLGRRGWLPLRQRALAAAERWMVERFRQSEGLGAIFPPMVWSIIALRCRGYQDDSPELQYCYRVLDGLVIEEEDSARLQPCKSPVWDTAIALRAILDSGVEPDREPVCQAAHWLLDKQVREAGDWALSTPTEPGGWFFEYANEFYPDLDDTAMVAMALHQQLAGQTRPTNESLPPGLQLVDGQQGERGRLDVLDRTSAALARAQRWMLAMQNRDGGWGAFDRDNDRQFLCHVPFADHNAMIDPSTPDLTARVLEALGALGKRRGDRAVDRAVKYVEQNQEPDGSWFGRWGVNYIYGTWQVLTGLTAVGMDPADPMLQAGVNWLIAHQQPSGGWGESPDSYADPSKRGQGTCTASQTAWAVLGLIACGEYAHPATLRGIRWLMNHQRIDGGWDEPEFTGTGFPRVFYLRYHMYSLYFPLMALARWSVAAAGRDELLEPVAQVLGISPGKNGEPLVEAAEPRVFWEDEEQR